MKKELSNLERIKAAWAMGWAAVLWDSTDFENMEYMVMSIPQHVDEIKFIWIKDSFGYQHCSQINTDDIEGMIITGYLYAGQLAGNEPIPEGQRFMVKKTNEIFSFLDFTNPPTTMDAPKLYGPVEGDKKGWGVYKPNSYFSKEEIEPVFD